MEVELYLLKKLAKEEPLRYREEIGNNLEAAIEAEHLETIQYIWTTTDSRARPNKNHLAHYLELVVETGNKEIYEYFESLNTVADYVKIQLLQKSLKKGKHELSLSIAKNTRFSKWSGDILLRDAISADQTELANTIFANIENMSEKSNEMLDYFNLIGDRKAMIFMLNQPSLKLDEINFIYAINAEAYNIVTKMVVGGNVGEEFLKDTLEDLKGKDSREILEGIIQARDEKILMDSLLNQSNRASQYKL